MLIKYVTLLCFNVLLLIFHVRGFSMKPLPVMKILAFIFLFLCLEAGSIFAKDPQYLHESIRARGMGGAFIAIANDENALFYNPAGLANLEKSYFELLKVSATVNDSILDTIDELNKDDSDEGKIFDNLIGKKAYLEIDLGAFSFASQSGRWGYNIFAKTVLDIEVHNPTLPFFDATIYAQGGIVGGYAMQFFKDKLDVGLSVKYVTRKGFVGDIAVSQLEKVIDNSDDFFEEKSVITGDIGFILHLTKSKKAKTKGFDTKLAFVAKNLGGMDFGKAGKIEASYDFGFAMEKRLFSFIDVAFAVDFIDSSYANTEFRSPKRNVKAGVEIGFLKLYNNHHLITVRAGMNGAYPTFGSSFNFWGIRLEYASWSEEFGNFAGDKEDKRQSVQISFIF
ncbi:MAG: hypothetical protein ACI86H_000571 [bacterium]